MPTVLRVGPYRFFFFSNEGNEPPHIHVESGSGVAKFWLTEVTLEKSANLRSHELAQIRRIVEENREQFIEAWHNYFNA